eukprot:Sspe_Gene.80322::Locus_50634_Transcript_2_2_Confidence_0.500_Length_778::g.80322::m.80322
MLHRPLIDTLRSTSPHRPGKTISDTTDLTGPPSPRLLTPPPPELPSPPMRRKGATTEWGVEGGGPIECMSKQDLHNLYLSLKRRSHEGVSRKLRDVLDRRYSSPPQPFVSPLRQHQPLVPLLVMPPPAGSAADELKRAEELREMEERMERRLEDMRDAQREELRRLEELQEAERRNTLMRMDEARREDREMDEVRRAEERLRLEEEVRRAADTIEEVRRADEQRREEERRKE